MKLFLKGKDVVKINVSENTANSIMLVPLKLKNWKQTRKRDKKQNKTKQNEKKKEKDVGLFQAQ